MRTRSLSRLPVALLPYPDETLTSWLSRTASIYGLTSHELLAEYEAFEPDSLEELDHTVTPFGLLLLQALLGGPMEQIHRCTLATVYPQWMPHWITRPAPLWDTSQRRTVTLTTGLRPAICPFCLLEDLDNGRSQYLRLSWHSSVTTVCPVHFIPLVTCCAEWSPHSFTHRGYWSRTKIMRCTACRRSFDLCRIAATGSKPNIAIARMEGLLRAALASDRVVDLADRIIVSRELLLFIEDIVWALMTQLPGKHDRVLHVLQVPDFPVPIGFVNPVHSEHWLSCAPLNVRRALVAVLTSLILQPVAGETLKSPAGSGIRFWRSLNSLLAPKDRESFQARTAAWSDGIIDAVEFY